MKEKCVSCESIGKTNDAVRVIDMFGDKIPVCRSCYEGIKENDITKVLFTDEDYQD